MAKDSGIKVKVGIVGPCEAGKTTLANFLAATASTTTLVWKLLIPILYYHHYHISSSRRAHIFDTRTAGHYISYTIRGLHPTLTLGMTCFCSKMLDLHMLSLR